MMMQDALPWIKSYFRSSSLTESSRTFVVRMMTAFMMHVGRMSASEAAGTVRSDTRHRAQVTRFLLSSTLGNSGDAYLSLVAGLLARESRRRGKWLFLIDNIQDIKHC